MTCCCRDSGPKFLLAVNLKEVGVARVTFASVVARVSKGLCEERAGVGQVSFRVVAARVLLLLS